MKPHLKYQAVVIIFFAATLLGCRTAKVTSSTSYTDSPAARPSVIYVSDFDLQAENIHKESSVVPRLDSPGPVRRLVLGESDDPFVVATKLVNLMADSVVKDLNKAGHSAHRLPPGTPVPTNGWIVRGVFTEVQEGNQLRRAIIGLGVGKTDLQVISAIDNLSLGPPKPLYEVQTAASSGDAPGAGPMIVISPGAAAARFVIAGSDLQRNVKDTAGKISDRIGQYLEKTK
jgi:hypothetical protein